MYSRNFNMELFKKIFIDTLSLENCCWFFKILLYFVLKKFYFSNVFCQNDLISWSHGITNSSSKIFTMDETHPGVEDQDMTQVLYKPSKKGFSKTNAVDMWYAFPQKGGFHLILGQVTELKNCLSWERHPRWLSPSPLFCAEKQPVGIQSSSSQCHQRRQLLCSSEVNIQFGRSWAGFRASQPCLEGPAGPAAAQWHLPGPLCLQEPAWSIHHLSYTAFPGPNVCWRIMNLTQMGVVWRSFLCESPGSVSLFVQSLGHSCELPKPEPSWARNQSCVPACSFQQQQIVFYFYCEPSDLSRKCPGNLH